MLRLRLTALGQILPSRREHSPKCSTPFATDDRQKYAQPRSTRPFFLRQVEDNSSHWATKSSYYPWYFTCSFGKFCSTSVSGEEDIEDMMPRKRKEEKHTRRPFKRTKRGRQMASFQRWARSRSLILIFKITTGDLDLFGEKDHQW